MSEEKLYFKTLKISRGWYLVEYSPPIPSYPFASIQLTTLENPQPTRISKAMESELEFWLNRYSIPVMVSSFDEKGALISMETERTCDHLFGWVDPKVGIVLHWRLVESHEFPIVPLEPTLLRSIYHDIPYRTSVDLKQAATVQRRQGRIGWWLVFVWAGVVPALIALVEFNSPRWLAWLTLFYSFSLAYVKALKLLGWWPKTPGDAQKADEDLRMRHHHYHCERNPEAFLRLKLENCERENRERLLAEALSLKDRHSVIVD